MSMLTKFIAKAGVLWLKWYKDCKKEIKTAAGISPTFLLVGIKIIPKNRNASITGHMIKIEDKYNINQIERLTFELGLPAKKVIRSVDWIIIKIINQKIWYFLNPITVIDRFRLYSINLMPRKIIHPTTSIIIYCKT